MAPQPDVECARGHSSNHRAEIEASQLCGCYACLRTFPPSAISHWLSTEDTATCPYCGIDAVLGSASGLPLTDEFLRALRARSFGFVEDEPLAPLSARDTELFIELLETPPEPTPALLEAVRRHRARAK